MIIKLKEQFEKAENLPVVRTEDGGNILIRQTWDGDKMMSIAEAKFVEGLTPEDFRDFFASFHLGPGEEANDIINKTEKVAEVEGFIVLKTEI